MSQSQSVVIQNLYSKLLYIGNHCKKVYGLRYRCVRKLYASFTSLDCFSLLTYNILHLEILYFRLMTA